MTHAHDEHDGSVNTGGLGGSRPPVSLLVHLAALGWMIGMLAFAYRAPDRYAAAMQEDRVVEWWTALLFASAAAIRITRAVRERRVVDGLIGLSKAGLRYPIMPYGPQADPGEGMAKSYAGKA